MATTYPGIIQSFSNPTGSSLLTSPDHASLHSTVNDTLGSVQSVMGTTAGTSVLKNFAAGHFATRQDAAGSPRILDINNFPIIELNSNGTGSWIQISNNGSGAPPMIAANGTASNVALYVSALGTSQISFLSPISQSTITAITTGTITTAGTVAGVIFGKTIAPNVGTIADAAGGTFVVNASTANIWYTALGTAAGNRTFGTPANIQPYQQLTYAVKTSGSANATAVWDSNTYRFSQDSGTPAFGTGVTWNYFNWRYNSIDSKFDFMGQIKNLI